MATRTKYKKPDEIIHLENKYAIKLTLSTESYDDYRVSLETTNTFRLEGNGKVVALDLSECGIEDLQFIDERFKGLEFLNLTRNSIKDISPLFKFSKLSMLFLGGNLITKITGIKKLKKLHTLALWNNQLDDFLDLGYLTGLSELYCQSTGNSSISFLKKLVNLSIIGFDVNSIEDISIINYLPKLKSATFSSNKISSIDEVNNPNLTSLNISSNLIRIIPRRFAEQFSWLKGNDRKNKFSFSDFDDNILAFNGNPLQFPPFSVVDLGKDSLINYYEACKKFGHAPLSEGRIIFIGDGSSGKTSIIEKILYNTFTLGREQTNGIKIEQLHIDHPEDKRRLTFNIWDFGGQEIQHAVHKFFFTEGCTYVLVLDNRKEEEPDYWLQQIESLGGGAPVFIVFNKHDENSAETVDRKYLKEKYPNIIGFYNTSCKTNVGIPDFKNALTQEIIKLQTVDEQFPKNWLNIKKSIQEGTTGSNNYLKYEAFKKICSNNQTENEDAQKLLLKYFNTIGSVTWFGEDTHLKFFHVLNPTWITQGVYKILTGKKTAKLYGQIRVSDFKDLLEPINDSDYKYSEGNYIYLLTMMKKFELCDSADDKNLLIPSAFGKEPKIEYSEFRGDDVRTYILQFKEYMPLALIHRFTAKKISEALENNYWYTGIVIKDSKSKTVAMVHADKELKRIYIRIKGNAKLGMWEYIRRDLASISSSYAKIDYEELVSVDGNVENTVSYEDLISYIQSEKSIYFHPRLKQDYNVGYLIGLFESTEGTVAKVRSGDIEIEHNGKNNTQIPNYVIQILNNNSPTITSNIVNNITISFVEQLSGDIKADASYLKNELDPANEKLIKSLEKIIEFANDAKTAKSIAEIKEKGWGRKLKSVLDSIGNTGEQFKNIHEGKDALISLFGSVKQLATHFNMSGIAEWFSAL